MINYDNEYVDGEGSLRASVLFSSCFWIIKPSIKIINTAIKTKCCFMGREEGGVRRL